PAMSLEDFQMGAGSLKASKRTSNPNCVKRSWIWTYFEETPDSESEICQATYNDGRICGSKLKKDQTKEAFRTSMNTSSKYTTLVIPSYQILTSQRIKIVLKIISLRIDLLKDQKYLAFTTDSWTSPNMMALMEITVNFVNSKFEFKEITLCFPHVSGNSFIFFLYKSNCVGSSNRVHGISVYV
ncbi:hypothetical protein VP01_2125g11, partial [Puccinia sorghi]